MDISYRRKYNMHQHILSIPLVDINTLTHAHTHTRARTHTLTHKERKEKKKKKQSSTIPPEISNSGK